MVGQCRWWEWWSDGGRMEVLGMEVVIVLWLWWWSGGGGVVVVLVVRWW
jgi:hypothetical protein